MHPKGRSRAETRDFSRETSCFNCGKEAIQQIEIRPDEVVITCMNCGAARRYRLNGVSLAEAQKGGDNRS